MRLWAGSSALAGQMPRGKRIQPCGGLLPWSAGGLDKWSRRSISVWINPCFLPQRDRIFPRDSRRGAIRSGFACFLSPVLCPRAAPFAFAARPRAGSASLQARVAFTLVKRASKPAVCAYRLAACPAHGGMPVPAENHLSILLVQIWVHSQGKEYFFL